MSLISKEILSAYTMQHALRIAHTRDSIAERRSRSADTGHKSFARLKERAHAQFAGFYLDFEYDFMRVESPYWKSTMSRPKSNNYANIPRYVSLWHCFSDDAFIHPLTSIDYSNSIMPPMKQQASADHERTLPNYSTLLSTQYFVVDSG